MNINERLGGQKVADSKSVTSTSIYGDRGLIDRQSCQ